MTTPFSGEGPAYPGIERDGYMHVTVNHKAGEYVRGGSRELCRQRLGAAFAVNGWVGPPIPRTVAPARPLQRAIAGEGLGRTGNSRGLDGGGTTSRRRCRDRPATLLRALRPLLRQQHCGADGASARPRARDGGSAGIGKAIALRLAEAGAKTLIVARDPAKLDLSREEFSVQSLAVETYSADISDPAQCAALIQRIVDNVRHAS